MYLAFMPFIKGGGLFVRTNNSHHPGDEIKLSVRLINDPEPYLVDTKVVWITPKGAQGNKPTGIGLQLLGENAPALFNKIEAYLGGMLKSTQLTDTI